MSKNYIQEGEVIEYVNSGAAILSGDVVVVGNAVGIALTDIPATTGTGSVQMCGVFSVKKVGSQAWAQGDLVFWDKTNLQFTKTASSDADTAVGRAWNVVGSGSGETTGQVLLVRGDGRKAASVAALAQTISGTYSQSEVQAISTKVDALLTALRNAGLVDS